MPLSLEGVVVGLANIVRTKDRTSFAKGVTVTLRGASVIACGTTYAQPLLPTSRPGEYSCGACRLCPRGGLGLTYVVTTPVQLELPT